MNSFSSLYESFPILHYNLPSACVPFLFVFAAYFFLIRRARVHSERAKLPKYNTIPTSTVKHIPNRQVLRDLSGNIDVAIVGSGIGALSNGATLARQGYKVAVFEQHQTVGGCTHTFEKEGFEFDVGVHYVGGFSSITQKMYSTLSDGQLKWTKLDESYDVIYNAKTGERIAMTDNYEENRRKLTKRFGIDGKTWKAFDRSCFWAKFWSYIVLQLKLWHPIVLRFAWPLLAAPYRRYALRSTTDVLHELGFSPEAAGALTYHWGDHGVSPKRSPFFLTSLLDTHYKGGGYFPRGGSSSIAKTLTAAIERRGGHVFALSPVEKILTKKNMLRQYVAVGIRVRGQDILVNNFVVSDAGFLATFGIDDDGAINKPVLVDADAGAAQRTLMRNTKGTSTVTPCVSDLSLFIGLDRSDDDLKLPAQNIWHLSNDYGWDHDSAWEAMVNDTSPKASTADHTPFLFISNESAKDPDFSLKHPGKSTSEVIAVCRCDLFDQWANTAHESRDENYLAIKERLTESYLDAFYLHFPQARGHVCFTSFGTPLTMNKFLGRCQGEVYALDHDISRFDSWNVQRALHPQTCVKNLYMTGEDAFLVSVTACMISGFIAAARATWGSWFDALPFVVQGLPQIFFG
mmetsp:Transcript_8117/g.14135  ORF Transcript_8117/g.14135 Transcript_8117/m.14135 type:complete len:630 (-) Transcript_8117:204-2093(-)